MFIRQVTQVLKKSVICGIKRPFGMALLCVIMPLFIFSAAIALHVLSFTAMGTKVNFKQILELALNFEQSRVVFPYHYYGTFYTNFKSEVPNAILPVPGRIELEEVHECESIDEMKRMILSDGDRWHRSGVFVENFDTMHPKVNLAVTRKKMPAITFFWEVYHKLFQESIGGSEIRIRHNVGEFKGKSGLDLNKIYSLIFCGGIMLSMMTPMLFLIGELFKEKSSKMLGIMRLNGLTMSAFFTSNFVLMIIYFIVPFLMGTILNLVFNFNRGSVLMVMISMILNLFARFGFLLIVVAVFPSVKLFYGMFYFLCYLEVVPCAYTLLQTFTSRVSPHVYYLLALYPTGGSGMLMHAAVAIDESFWDTLTNREVLNCLGLAVAGSFFYFFFGIYLYQVFPQKEQGASKPWNFLWSRSKKLSEKEIEELAQKAKEEKELGLLDPDVAEQIDKVDSNQVNDDALVVRHLEKRYGPKRALNDVTFSVPTNSIFGLLGPNGAGKTTLMKTITGLVQASNGSCQVAGFDCHSEMQKVYNVLGFCPQHDIHFPLLNVRQHLEFFCALKGDKDVSKKVSQLMDFVHLTALQFHLPSELSGGEKRRLSIAIAFAGESRVIFLDEPTTGLDPEIRKMIWGIISAAKQNRAVILSTHSMEEAEILSDQLTIMARGALKCFGTPLALQKKFGGNITISVVIADGFKKNALEYLKSFLDVVVSYESEHYAKLLFHGKLSELCAYFDQIQKGKQAHGIVHWGISQPSLEEVFINIVKEGEAEG